MHHLLHHNTQQLAHKFYGIVSPNLAEVIDSQASYLHKRGRRVGRSWGPWGTHAEFVSWQLDCKCHTVRLEAWIFSHSLLGSMIFNYEYEDTTINWTALGWITKSDKYFHKRMHGSWNHCFILLLTAACLILYSRQVGATSGNVVSFWFIHEVPQSPNSVIEPTYTIPKMV